MNKIITPSNLGPIQVHGSRLSIWLGSEDGGGKRGLVAGDLRSLALLQLDLEKVEIVRCNGREHYTSTADRIACVKKKMPKHIRLDPRFAITLQEHPQMYPDVWKGTHIFWDGFSLRGLCGDRLALCTYWNDGVVLDYTDGWYDDSREPGEFSALLAMDYVS